MKITPVQKAAAALTLLMAMALTVPVAAALSPQRASSPLYGTVIVLDAGHGGSDAGCTYQGVRESDLALAITLRLGSLIQQAGGQVVYTRTDQSGLTDASGHWDKQQDMRLRAQVIQQANPQLVVSLHLNCFPTPQTGAQIFVQRPASPASAALAEQVRQAICDQLMPENTRRVQQGDYYILRNAPCDGILIECGFLNNPSQLVLLKDPLWQDRFALAVYTGLASFLATQPRQSPTPPATGTTAQRVA